MEQKRPADIFQELLDYLWNGLGLEEKGWKRLKKGDFKKKMKNGLTYLIWFERSRYNYIDYEIGHGNVEVGFSCTIKLGNDLLYAFDMESPTGGLRFRMLTEDLRLNTGLLDTFLPLIKAHYLDFIDRFEVDPTGALQPVCAPFIQPEDYSWRIHVDEQMVERYGTPEQLTEYRRQAELRGTPEHKAKNWMGSMLFHLSHANDVDQAWASSRTKEELDKVVEPFVQAKRQTGQWTQEDEAGYQLYQ
ncbi:spondin [[Clostridium] innocuum]|nr:spondin [[Clostridium] innocuum]